MRRDKLRAVSPNIKEDTTGLHHFKGRSGSVPVCFHFSFIYQIEAVI
jgi:hypothetical protein